MSSERHPGLGPMTVWIPQRSRAADSRLRLQLPVEADLGLKVVLLEHEEAFIERPFSFHGETLLHFSYCSCKLKPVAPGSC